MGSYFHGFYYRILPMTWRQHDSIMVVVDKLTKVAHFIPVKSTHKMDGIAKIFMKEIFKLHGLPKAIISDRCQVHFQFLEGVVCRFGYKIKLQHCIPSSDRWADGETKSGA